MSCGGEDEVDGVTGGGGGEVAAEMAVLLQVADGLLDACAPPDPAANGGRYATLLAREENAGLVGVVAAIAAIDIGAVDGQYPSGQGRG